MPRFSKLTAVLLVGASLCHCGQHTNLCASVTCDGGTQCDPSNGTCAAAGSDGGATCSPPCTSPPLLVCDTTSTFPTCRVCTVTQGCSGSTPTCDEAQGNGLGACEVCTPFGGCSGATPKCDTSVPGGQCVGCLTNADCGGATPLCDPPSNTCVSADGGFANARCSGATALVFDDAGVATASGDNSQSVNSSQPGDQSPNCSVLALQTGKPVVYDFTLSGPQDVTLTVTPAGDVGTAPTLAPVVYVRAPGECPSGALANQLSCDARPLGQTSFTTLYDLPAGTYSIWISSDGAALAGPFTIEATLAPPTVPPPNESCATAQALTFVGGVATVAGTTRGSTHAAEPADAGSPSCSASAATSGVEVVYSYTLAQPQDVSVTVTPSAGSALQAVVFVRAPNACANDSLATELACDNPLVFGEGAATDILMLDQAPGTYFVWVSGALNSAGDFTLTAAETGPTLPPPNATCATAQPLSFPVSSLMGTTYGSSNLTNDACSGVPLSSSGPEVVYSFSVGQPSHFEATVTPVDGGPGPGLFAYAYIRDSADCTQTTQQGSWGCVTASTPSSAATLVASDLTAGTYDLVVDGYKTTFATPSGGPFTLDATLTPANGPPANVSCSAAQAVSLVPSAAGMLAATVQGDTTGAGNALALSCVQPAAPAPYVLYEVGVPPLSGGATSYNARAVIYGENDDANMPGVSLSGQCGGGALPYDCEVEPGALGTFVYAQAVVVALGLDGGEALFATVGSAVTLDAGSNAGPFSALFEVAASPEPNDTCAGAAPLSPNTSVPGTTLGGNDDYDLFNGYYQSDADAGFQCQYAVVSGQADMTGADVVYSYAATATGPVTVLVEPELGFDVAVGVLNACAPGACIAWTHAAFEGGAEQVTFQAVAGATYYLLVDGPTAASDTRGGFGISVSL
jgi:hypothetical protein